MEQPLVHALGCFPSSSFILAWSRGFYFLSYFISLIALTELFKSSLEALFNSLFLHVHLFLLLLNKTSLILLIVLLLILWKILLLAYPCHDQKKSHLPKAPKTTILFFFFFSVFWVQRCANAFWCLLLSWAYVNHLI